MAAGTRPFDRWVHDVRNQLSVILGFSEMLLQDLPGDDLKRHDVEEIHAAAARAMAVLAQGPRTEDEGGR